MKRILFYAIGIALAVLPAGARDEGQAKAPSQPAKVKAEGTHYVVPIKNGPDAARPGHPGKSFELTEVKASRKPVVKRPHHRVHHRDRFSTMRETIREAARKQ